MRLKKLILKNFRGYKEETQIIFENDLTAFTGKNDTGKSSILDALEIFFNNQTIKIDEGDKNIKNTSPEVIIGCVFDELPPQVIVDEKYPTNFKEEYLVNIDNEIEIHKTFKIQKTVAAPSITIKCLHPTQERVNKLHSTKLSDLKKLGKELGVENSVDDQRVASLWRKAIWNSCNDLKLSLIDLNVDDLEKESKSIYKKIEIELPTFALFKADRESVDDDPEAKNPMQAAVNQAKKELQTEIDALQSKIEKSVFDVALRTLEKLREMDPKLASELIPRFKDKPKWTFNFTLDGDEGVPINKRGSGVRRLVLLNFFRAEAEKKRLETQAPRVIYAIEEPETSQHPNYQQMLIEALLQLSIKPECQVIITTHVPALAGLLPIDSIRLIEKDNNNQPTICLSNDDVLEKIANSLGVLPESNIASSKAVLLVEGHSDVTFINHSANVLKEAGIIKKSLQENGISAIPIGGCGNLKHWVTKRLIDQLGLNWAVLMDSDIGDEIQYQRNLKNIEAIKEQGKIGILTKKREPENYFDPKIFKDSHNIEISFTDKCNAKKIIASAISVREDDLLDKYWPRMKAEQIQKCSEYKTGDNNHYEIKEIIEQVCTLTKS
jgi:predicted ATP-dependent endonuclease of OLD family